MSKEPTYHDGCYPLSDQDIARGDFLHDERRDNRGDKDQSVKPCFAVGMGDPSEDRYDEAAP